jgi:malonyl CoA-acyl carrier protein transacylase
MTAFMFAGQGTQIKGMGRNVFNKFPALVNQANDLLGYSIVDICIENKNNLLNQTKYTQPAIFLVCALLYLEEYYATANLPTFAAGHSLGEYTALFAAGVFDFGTAFLLVKKRGELMEDNALAGGMAAVVGLSEQKIQDIISQHHFNSLQIANENSPTQFVISGDKKEISNAQSIFESNHAKMYSVLNVSGAFHSNFMNNTINDFYSYINKIEIKEPKFPVISNVTATPHMLSTIKDNLVKQLTHRVCWRQCIEYILKNNEHAFKEINPSKKRTLTKLLEHIKTKK